MQVSKNIVLLFLSHFLVQDFEVYLKEIHPDISFRVHRRECDCFSLPKLKANLIVPSVAGWKISPDKMQLEVQDIIKNLVLSITCYFFMCIVL